MAPPSACSSAAAHASSAAGVSTSVHGVASSAGAAAAGTAGPSNASPEGRSARMTAPSGCSNDPAAPAQPARRVYSDRLRARLEDRTGKPAARRTWRVAEGRRRHERQRRVVRRGRESVLRPRKAGDVTRGGCCARLRCRGRLAAAAGARSRGGGVERGVHAVESDVKHACEAPRSAIRQSDQPLLCQVPLPLHAPVSASHASASSVRPTPGGQPCRARPRERARRKTRKPCGVTLPPPREGRASKRCSSACARAASAAVASRKAGDVAWWNQ